MECKCLHPMEKCLLMLKYVCYMCTGKEPTNVSPCISNCLCPHNILLYLYWYFLFMLILRCIMLCLMGCDKSIFQLAWKKHEAMPHNHTRHCIDIGQHGQFAISLESITYNMYSARFFMNQHSIRVMWMSWFGTKFCLCMKMPFAVLSGGKPCCSYPVSFGHQH